MKRMIAVLAVTMLLLLCFAGCNQIGQTTEDSTAETSGKKESANVFAIAGPTGIGFANLMKKSDDGKALLDYHFSVESAPDAITAKISTGEADIAAIPTNLAAVLYKKTSGSIQMLAINTGCVLSFVENGDTTHSVEDLKGKTIYSTGEGANPEAILRYLLESYGLDSRKDVNIRFVTENEELATMLASGRAKIALVPEPLCTTVLMKNNQLRVAFGVEDVWKETKRANMPQMGCVVARKAYIEEHPDAIQLFLQEYEESIKNASEQVKETAALCETYQIIPKAAIAEKAIPNCQLTFISGKDMQPVLQGYFDILYKANPKMLGGSLPEDGLYYIG